MNMFMLWVSFKQCNNKRKHDDVAILTHLLMGRLRLCLISTKNLAKNGMGHAGLRVAQLCNFNKGGAK